MLVVLPVPAAASTSMVWAMLFTIASRAVESCGLVCLFIAGLRSSKFPHGVEFLVVAILQHLFHASGECFGISADSFEIAIRAVFVVGGGWVSAGGYEFAEVGEYFIAFVFQIGRVIFYAFASAAIAGEIISDRFNLAG
jgi:hypothetical protein